MTFFQVAAVFGADLEEKVDDEDRDMKLVWDRKDVKSAATVVSGTGVVGKIT